MIDTETTRRLVTEFWAAMQANDWAAAAALFADDYALHWPQSGERIRGAANFVAVNSTYPAAGTWHFTVDRLVVEGEQAVTDQVRYVSVRTLDEVDPEWLSPLVAEAAMVAIERGARASVR